MKKLKKRYYVLALVVALVAGAFLRGVEEKSFEIVRNSVAYAPEEKVQAVAVEEEEPTEDLININEADVSELDKLTGIGETLGKRIVDYRTKNGKFEVIQDIMKVSGIGEKKFDAIKDQICVE